jgi:hypothetical protein
VSKAVRPLLTQAASQLREVGVDSPEQEARQLLAYAVGIELARVPLLDSVDDDQASHFQTLINKRAHRTRRTTGWTPPSNSTCGIWSARFLSSTAPLTW